MDIVNEMMAALGGAWVIAVVLEFLTIVVESAATDQSQQVEAGPDGEPPKNLAKTLVMFASSLSTVFLFVHVLFHAVSAGVYLKLLITGVGVVAAIILIGGLLGAGLSRTPLRRFAETVQFPMALFALGATLYATMPTVATFARLYLGFALPF